jgi:hypothetical protein
MKQMLLGGIAVVFITCLSNCYSTQTYQPELNLMGKYIIDSISRQYDFEDVKLTAKSTTGTSGNHTEILAECINSKDLSNSDTIKLVGIAKDLAKRIKKAVETPADYDTYEINFITTKTDGNVTNNSGLEFDFEVKDLQH